jgi:hypothetical protein
MDGTPAAVDLNVEHGRQERVTNSHAASYADEYVNVTSRQAFAI